MRFLAALKSEMGFLKSKEREITILSEHGASRGRQRADRLLQQNLPITEVLDGDAAFDHHVGGRVLQQKAGDTSPIPQLQVWTQRPQLK
jgi:hypothetical protein